MNNNPSSLFACCVAILGSALALPAAHAETAEKNSGFLSDYSKLQKAGMPMNHYMIYRDPALAGYAGKAVYLAPAAVFPADATFPNISPEVVAGTLKSFDKALRERLSPKVKLVDAPDAADLVLQAAVTQVNSEEKGKTIVDVIPARAVTNVVKEVALGEAMVAATSLEAKLVDARTGQIVAELMQHSPGKGIGRSGSDKTHVTLEALQPAIEDSAKLVAEQMVP